MKTVTAPDISQLRAAAYPRFSCFVWMMHRPDQFLILRAAHHTNYAVMPISCVVTWFWEQPDIAPLPGSVPLPKKHVLHLTRKVHDIPRYNFSFVLDLPENVALTLLLPDNRFRKHHPVIIEPCEAGEDDSFEQTGVALQTSSDARKKGLQKKGEKKNLIHIIAYSV